MRHAIFLTVARDAEIEIRIAQFRRSADRAFVQWFGFAARLASKTLAARRDFTAVPCLVNDFWSKKDQIIGQRRDERHAVGVRADDEPENQESR